MRRHDPFLKLLYRAGARDAASLFFPDLARLIDWDHLRWIDKEAPLLGDSPGSMAWALTSWMRQQAPRAELRLDVMGKITGVGARYTTPIVLGIDVVF